MARKANKLTQGKAESITVRLDPKIRYALELLARKQRRNLSSVVEWALQNAINDKDNGLIEKGKNGADCNYLLFLWDVEESDRLYQLAIYHADWLTFEEECLVKLIRESDYFQYLDKEYAEKYKADIEKDNWHTYHAAMRPKLREYYPTYKKVASGELTKDSLPKPPRGWSKGKTQKKSENNGSAAA